MGLLPLLDFPSGYCLSVGNFDRFSENLSLLIVGFSGLVIFLQKSHLGLLPLLDFPSGHCLIDGNFGHFSEKLSL